MRHAYWIVNDKLCGRPGPNEFAWKAEDLFEAGVRAVLSVNKGDGVVPKDLKKLGISYKRVSLPVTTPPTSRDMKACQKKLPKAFEFVQGQIQQGRPVLVHCRHGNDRTGLFLAYFLARQYGMTADKAIEAVRARRAACLSAHGWQRFARELIDQQTPVLTVEEPDLELSD